jgi:DNA-directed RNA polymerase specialized sigma24 family protein
MLAEAAEGLLRGLEEPERTIVTLGFQGYTAGEISTRLERPERTVYRVLHRVKERLRRMRAGGAPTP